MGLVSQVLANAPVYPEVPSVKLFTNNVGLTPAFDLAWFNTAPDGFNSGGDAGKSYLITTNFKGLSTLSTSSFSGLSSLVSIVGYSAATDGSNAFSITNAGGTTPASNKVKFATYRQNEYGKVGLTVGSSITIPLASYTAGNVAALAPSFGSNANALIVSDTTKINAAWSGNTAVTIILASGNSTQPLYVDIIASPVSTLPIGTDQDRERIQVYTNLISNGTFSTANDTTAYGPQPAPGRTAFGTVSWLASQADSAGNVANGVLEFTLGSANGGVEYTPVPANYIPVTQGKWYISRARIADSLAGNNDSAFLFSFSQAAANSITSDISADVINGSGIPTTWTWLEAPVYVHSQPSGSTAFPQLQFKAGATFGNVFLDEIQVIQATPRLVDGARGDVRAFQAGGLFANTASTTLWGTQGYYNGQALSLATPQPVFGYVSDTVIGASLSANFAGAAAGANMLGFKWTYGGVAGGVGVVTTQTITLGRQYGASMELNPGSGLSGTNNNQVLIVAYGVSAANSSTAALDRIDAAAEVGVIAPGTLATIEIAGVAIATDLNAYVQFGFRADAPAIVNFSNVDVLVDGNDPNFGDGTLFP